MSQEQDPAGSGDGGNGSAKKRVYSEETFTLDDVLEAEAHWEDTANAVLGASDNKNCSYNEGYVKRQALYSCLTCTPPSDDPNFKPAGICLACSLNCHFGHDLVELYTKRNFRCDCGNQKFPSTRCKLQPEKDEFNTKNSYNHNFKGLYCICNRPYPDPEEEENEDEEDDDEDEMIQCVICEDWLHGKHSKNGLFDYTSDETSEFICAHCTQKCDFLSHYGKFMSGSASSAETNVAATDNASAISNLDDRIDEGIGSPSTEPAKESPMDIVASATGGHLSSETCETEDATSQDSGTVVSAGSDTCDEEGSQGSMFCLLNGSMKTKTEHSGGTWWRSGWRSGLCKCSKCLEKYETLKVSFLLDVDDTLAAYEAKGKAKGSTYETAQEILTTAMAKLDHVAQIEVIHGYNEMKTALEECLRKIAESGRVVTREDITSFFAELSSKRRKTDSGVYIPHNCR